MLDEAGLKSWLEGKFFHEPSAKKQALVAPQPKKGIYRKRRLLPQGCHMVRPEWRPLYEAVAIAHGVTSDHMRNSGMPDATMARAHFAWEIKRRTGMGNVWISKLMGINHTSVMYYLKKFTASSARNARLIAFVNEAFPFDDGGGGHCEVSSQCHNATHD